MKKFILLSILFLNSVSAFAGECRLRHPMPIRDFILTPQPIDKPHRLFFKNGLVDHLPLGDYYGKELWRNGELEVRVHQIYTYPGSWIFTPTEYLGVSINGSRGLGIGLAEGYNGVPLSGQIVRQNGEAVYTTIAEPGKYQSSSTVKISGGHITSVEFTVPVKKEVRGWYESTGEADTICVLDMEPDFEREH